MRFNAQRTTDICGLWTFEPCFACARFRPVFGAASCHRLGQPPTGTEPKPQEIRPEAEKSGPPGRTVTWTRVQPVFEVRFREVSDHVTGGP